LIPDDDVIGSESVALQFLGETEPNRRRDAIGMSGKGSAAHGVEASMKTRTHLKRHGVVYFHLHPLHAMFSLTTGFVLAVLVVLMLASSAR